MGIKVKDGIKVTKMLILKQRDYPGFFKVKRDAEQESEGGVTAEERHSEMQCCWL